MASIPGGCRLASAWTHPVNGTLPAPEALGLSSKGAEGGSKPSPVAASLPPLLPEAGQYKDHLPATCSGGDAVPGLLAHSTSASLLGRTASCLWVVLCRPPLSWSRSLLARFSSEGSVGGQPETVVPKPAPGRPPAAPGAKGGWGRMYGRMAQLGLVGLSC